VTVNFSKSSIKFAFRFVSELGTTLALGVCDFTESLFFKREANGRFSIVLRCMGVV